MNLVAAAPPNPPEGNEIIVVDLTGTAGAEVAHTLPNKKYIRHTKVMLQNLFPLISCAAIDAILSSSKYKFKGSFTVLRNIESQRSDIDGDGAGQFDGIPPRIKVFIKRNRPAKKLTAIDERLSAEIDAIPELNTKVGTHPVDPSVVGSVEEDVDDATRECLCCYGDFTMSEMRGCSAGSGHLVCKDCIYRFVSEQLDGNGSALFKCIVDADCEHKYSLALLDQVLSPKLNKRANDLVFREETKKAGLGNVW